MKINLYKMSRVKYFLKQGTNGGFIGIGISMAFFLAFFPDSHQNIVISVVNYIVFGFIMGYMISSSIYIVELIIHSFLPRSVINIFLELFLAFIVSTGVFYGIGTILNNFSIPPEYLFYISLAVGLASTMVALFYIVIEEQAEKVELEKENSKLAVLEERNRIARELHDSVSQNLFGINLNLNSLPVLLDKDIDRSKDIIIQMQNMVQEIQTEMRLLIYELRPVALQEKGFFEAIESMIELFKNRYNKEIVYYFQGDEEELNSQQHLTLYRILQEALNNVVRHANATRTTVNLLIEDKGAILKIKDNGSGFDKGKVDYSRNFGLKGIEERIKQLNGSLEINSQIDKGTEILVKI